MLNPNQKKKKPSILNELVFLKGGSLPMKVIEVNEHHLTVEWTYRNVKQSMTLNKENFTNKPK